MLNAVVYISQVIIDGGQNDHLLERSPSCFAFVDSFAINVGKKTKCFRNVMHNWRLIHPRQPLCRSLSFWGFYNRLQSKIGILNRTDMLFCGTQDYVIEALKRKIGFTPIINMICHGFPLNDKVSDLFTLKFGKQVQWKEDSFPKLKLNSTPMAMVFGSTKQRNRFLAGVGWNRLVIGAIKTESEQEVLKPYFGPSHQECILIFCCRKQMNYLHLGIHY